MQAWPRSAAARQKLLSEAKAFLFDCDGVIWRGNKLIEGVPAALDHLRALDKRILFITNNSTRSRRDVAAKFQQLGLGWVTERHVLNSAYAAADCLANRLHVPTSRKVYVVGEKGIVEELHQAGYQHVLGGPEHDRLFLDTVPDHFEVDPDVGAVVVGFDRYFNYHKLTYATMCVLHNHHCLFLATNCDARAHLNQAQEWPGGGTMVAALEKAIGRPPIVAGKPESHLFELACRELGLSQTDDAPHMYMVGDRLDTDIAFGSRYGMTTLLVMTGVTDERMLREEGHGEQEPTWIIQSLSDLSGGDSE